MCWKSGEDQITNKSRKFLKEETVAKLCPLCVKLALDKFLFYINNDLFVFLIYIKNLGKTCLFNLFVKHVLTPLNFWLTLNDLKNIESELSLTRASLKIWQ